MLPGSTKYTDHIIEVKPECLKCSYYNPKVQVAYKCYIKGTCPAYSKKNK